MVATTLEVSAGCPDSAAAIALLDFTCTDFDLIYASSKGDRFLPRLTHQGRTICGFAAIARHGLKPHALYSGDAERLAAIDQWLDAVYSDIRPLVAALSRPNSAAAADELTSYLADLQKSLPKGKFLASSEPTVADLAFLLNVLPAMRFFLGSARLSRLTQLSAYVKALAELPLTKALVGRVEFASEPLKISASKPTAPAKAAPPKKPAPPAEEDEVREVKKEYVFPETTFNFHDFKTLYVNAKDKQEALDYLWKNWDAAAFSFWYLVYDKLPSECKKVFLTSNLMNGFISRAEFCRKFVLGVHTVHGEEPDLEVRGVWMWRGTDMLEPLKEHQQFEVYKYRKLELTNAEDKALIEEYWTKTADSPTVEGQTLQVLKCVK